MKKLVLTIAIIFTGVFNQLSAQSYYSNYNTTSRRSPGSYTTNQIYYSPSRTTSVYTTRSYSTGNNYSSSTSVYRNNSLKSYSTTTSYSTGSYRTTATSRYDGMGNYKGTKINTTYKW